MQLLALLQTIQHTINQLAAANQWSESFSAELSPTKDKTHGDYATNAAMVLANIAKRPPRDIAEHIKTTLEALDAPISAITIAGPGFINLTFDKRAFASIVPHILQTDTYGQGEPNHTRVLLEYVSANPTGTLHIGHARGGAYGDNLARILTKAGYTVFKEFYVNDGGQQIKNLALSIYARYANRLGEDVRIPDDGYFGEEIIDVATQIQARYGDGLTDANLDLFQEEGVRLMLARLESDLASYGVTFDAWFREQDLYPQAVDNVVQSLKETGHTFTEDDALWLKTSAFGDEKDRVMITSDKRYTYFVPDTAYHKTKFDRGFDQLINVWGADHHGTIPRLQASLTMLGYPVDKLSIELLQMVKVYQSGVEVKMSKRSGQAIGLLDLIEEVGVDPVRYFFAARALSTPMDLDLDLALRKTNENPVYYAQYAHARIHSIFAKANRTITKVTTFHHLNDVAHPLLMSLSEYPLVIQEAAQKRIPHRITQYIQTLAGLFHSYYSEQVIVSDDPVATNEQLLLIQAVARVLQDALQLIGVSAPERM
jgi:arginyl-tRNA synthetase